jgi:hypothetical protein
MTIDHDTQCFIDSLLATCASIAAINLHTAITKRFRVVIFDPNKLCGGT